MTVAGSLYYNYKHLFFVSSVGSSLCDSNYRFLFVDVGAHRKFSNSTIFKNSVLYMKLKNNTLNISEGQPLIQGSNTNTPFVIIGDEGFLNFCCALTEVNFYQSKKRLFNYRLARARRYIECIFGILASKWAIFL
jgi:hypothetical protein